MGEDGAEWVSEVSAVGCMNLLGMLAARLKKPDRTALECFGMKRPEAKHSWLVREMRRGIAIGGWGNFISASRMHRQNRASRSLEKLFTELH